MGAFVAGALRVLDACNRVAAAQRAALEDEADGGAAARSFLASLDLAEKLAGTQYDDRPRAVDALAALAGSEGRVCTFSLTPIETDDDVATDDRGDVWAAPLLALWNHRAGHV